MTKIIIKTEEKLLTEMLGGNSEQITIAMPSLEFSKRKHNEWASMESLKEWNNKLSEILLNCADNELLIKITELQKEIMEK